METFREYIVLPDKHVFDGKHHYYGGDIVFLTDEQFAGWPQDEIVPHESEPKAPTQIEGTPEETEQPLPEIDDVELADRTYEPLPDIADEPTSDPLQEVRLGDMTVAHLELLAEALDIPKQRPKEKKASLLVRVAEALTDEALARPGVQTALTHIAAEQ